MDLSYTQMVTINSTFFYDNETPTITKKELPTSIIMDTIRDSISSQYLHTFGAKPDHRNLEMLLDGFVLFNLHKNKNMLNSKDELLKYLNNKGVSLEEKLYFYDIYLYNQRPKFLFEEEHEYIRCCGNLDNYYKGCLDDENEKNDDIYISRLLDSMENTVSVISSKYSNLIKT